MTRKATRRRWSERARGAAWALGGLVAVVAIGALAGLVPVRASSGHWPVTHWALQFFMSRAVSTQSLTVRVEPHDDPAMVRLGAAHYQLACLPCHGGPSEPPQQVPLAMTPEPPYVPVEVGRWSPRELFFIVKHGVKFTAMPAWPAQQRDDEVWAMVAFLRRLPELDVEGYRRLAFGDTEAPAGDLELSFEPTDEDLRERLELCARCHGPGGRGLDGVAPRLAGQRAEYLYASLAGYARGERPSGIMGPIAAELGARDAQRLADHYASLAAPTPGDPTSEPSSGAETDGGAGAEIAHRGLPSRKLPSCADCHGPGTSPRNPRYPELAGLDPGYLERQLELFAEGTRGGDGYGRIMSQVAAQLEPEQRREVALYYSSLGGSLGSSLEGSREDPVEPRAAAADVSPP